MSFTEDQVKVAVANSKNLSARLMSSMYPTEVPLNTEGSADDRCTLNMVRGRMGKFYGIFGFNKKEKKSGKLLITRGKLDKLSHAINTSRETLISECGSNREFYDAVAAQNTNLLSYDAIIHAVDFEVDDKEGTLMRVIKIGDGNTSMTVNVYRTGRVTIANPTLFQQVFGIDLNHPEQHDSCFKAKWPKEPTAKIAADEGAFVIDSATGKIMSKAVAATQTVEDVPTEDVPAEDVSAEDVPAEDGGDVAETAENDVEADEQDELLEDVEDENHPMAEFMEDDESAEEEVDGSVDSL